MAVEYRCLFGISSHIRGLEAGNQINAFFDHATIVTIHGKNGRLYWFLIEKLARRYVYPDVPRFTEKDMASVASQYRERQLYQDITFGHVWDAQETVSMTALEENVFSTWHHGRMALLGDSVHKVCRCNLQISALSLPGINRLTVATDDTKYRPGSKHGHRRRGRHDRSPDQLHADNAKTPHRFASPVHVRSISPNPLRPGPEHLPDLPFPSPVSGSGWLLQHPFWALFCSLRTRPARGYGLQDHRRRRGLSVPPNASTRWARMASLSAQGMVLSAIRSFGIAFNFCPCHGVLAEERL